MLRFKQFLKEYLTDEQREAYSDIKNAKMTPGAREATDDFFGVGNDHVRRSLNDWF